MNLTDPSSNYSVVLPLLNNCRHHAVHAVEGITLYYVLAYFLPCFLCVGLVGNVLILITLRAQANRQNAKANLFLAAKAVADLCFELFVLVNNVTVYTVASDDDGFSRFYYHGIQRFIVSTMNWLLLSSTWFAVAATFERMFAIARPLQALHQLQQHRLVICIVNITVVSFLLTIYPYVCLTNVTYIDCDRPWRHVYGSTGPLSKDNPVLWYYGYLSRLVHNVLASLLPVVLLMGFNSTIVYHLRHRNQSLNRFADAGMSTKDAKEQIKVSVVVFTITATTAVFLCPSAVVVIYDAVYYTSRKSRSYRAFVHAANLLVVCGKVLDFFLYCVVSSKFRRQLIVACKLDQCIARVRKISQRSQDTIFSKQSLQSDNGSLRMNLIHGDASGALKRKVGHRSSGPF